MKVTNTQAGPRGINTVNGPVLVEPNDTVEVEVFEREKEHIEATGWFEIKGDYTANPGRAAPVQQSSSSDVEELRRQLAEREAEIKKLKEAEKPSERDELKKQAEELGLQYPGNISNAKLKEMIDAKLAS